MIERKSIRHAVYVEATLIIGTVKRPCAVRNVSLGGAFIVGPVLAVDTRATLRMGAPGFIEIVTACTARWENGQGTGLRFDGMRAFDTYELARFIRNAQRATGRLSVDDIIAANKPY